jgi:PAS domain S-box-containing protein
MAAEEKEQELLRSVALQNAQSILLARQRAERELLQAHEALARKTDELARSLAMMRATLESTTDAILVTDARGRVTDFNQRFVDLWGLSSHVMEAMHHKSVMEATSRRFQDPQKFCARIEEIYANSPPESYDLLERADGRVIERFSRIQSIDGRNVGRVWSFREITERKRVEAELQQANRKKDEFLAILAHELRNPLAPIRNSLQLLKLAGGDPEITEKARAIMDQSLHQMIRLVDDLLEVSRITTGKLELRTQQVVDLAAVVRTAVETSRPMIEDQEHKLTVSLPADPVFLEADPIRLAQVFSNLLNNSAKYSEPGGNIRLHAISEGDQAIVRIIDTGIGIPANHLSRIFEMFTQVDATLEKSRGGLGIGLSLVKALVDMHGGRVEAHSEGPGKGSEFVVHLPIAAHHAESERNALDDRNRNPACALNWRILVVDDNRLSCDTAVMALRQMGCEVAAAYDGFQALTIAAGFRPDAILLDIGMPQLSGYDVARQIRTQPWGENVYLIAVTGYGQLEDRRRSLAAGFDYHLVKPIDFTELERNLEKLKHPRSKSAQ